MESISKSERLYSRGQSEGCRELFSIVNHLQFDLAWPHQHLVDFVQCNVLATFPFADTTTSPGKIPFFTASEPIATKSTSNRWKSDLSLNRCMPLMSYSICRPNCSFG